MPVTCVLVEPCADQSVPLPPESEAQKMKLNAFCKSCDSDFIKIKPGLTVVSKKFAPHLTLIHIYQPWAACPMQQPCRQTAWDWLNEKGRGFGAAFAWACVCTLILSLRIWWAPLLSTGSALVLCTTNNKAASTSLHTSAHVKVFLWMSSWSALGLSLRR